ncbi:class I SAM-dependent methyltransferase [Nocardioides sp.]|uniref:class I SAM-dependent methyltransferase n=1 Tax=Nocardioides sp. TaxID=35761 RepID=UPI002CF3EFC3|nr:methyltransferase domain-containing protein [Nocardioides sp.]HVX54695.1 methyltransferase domain-containing protein [Nocardioides sp.]
MSDLFSDKLAIWREYTESPWARIRYAVVGAILRRHTSELGGRLRVLDVGGGDGMDSLPLARAGHDVTIVDPTSAWLAEARRRADEAGATITTVEAGLDDLPAGEWDLVLCHFVLRYRSADAGDVAALAERVRPGGRLSVMDVNPDGRVLRALLNDGPAGALGELAAERATVETFQTDARKVTWNSTADEMATAGLRQLGLYGNRIANDLLVDNAAKHDPAYFTGLLDLELALCDREPFNRIGFAWQLVAERVG